MAAKRIGAFWYACIELSISSPSLMLYALECSFACWKIDFAASTDLPSFTTMR